MKAGSFSGTSHLTMLHCSPPASPRQQTLKRSPPPCLLRGSWLWRLLWSGPPLSPRKPRFLSKWTAEVTWWRSRETRGPVPPVQPLHIQPLNTQPSIRLNVGSYWSHSQLLLFFSPLVHKHTLLGSLQVNPLPAAFLRSPTAFFFLFLNHSSTSLQCCYW